MKNSLERHRSFANKNLLSRKRLSALFSAFLLATNVLPAASADDDLNSLSTLPVRQTDESILTSDNFTSLTPNMPEEPIKVTPITTAKQAADQEQENTPEKQIEQEAVLSFVGDLMLGDLTNVTSGFSAAFNQYGPIMLNGVKSEFTKDDLTVGNLEGPLTSNPQTAWVDKSGGTASPGSSRNYY